ncbi:DUF2927 domain-containing protein [Roseobacteraceae bacterium S113]
MGGPGIKSAALAGMLALSGCTLLAPVEPVPVPPARPTALVPAPAPEIDAQPSEKSRAASAYYTRLEARLVSQGMLRTDGGGIDTPYDADDLLRNFERIAFYDEYVRGQGLTVSVGGAGQLKRWVGPIRFGVEHGARVPVASHAADRAEVARYVTRLQRLTGHPMSMNDADPNFHVLYMSKDDDPTLPGRIKEIVPNINPKALEIFDGLPNYVHCLVIAFSGTPGGHDYARAIAVIRAEHPSLLRRSCVHEELAQGLGLANDSLRARPSIFNDDDEFALLTSHDELLLKALYDPRMRPGMSLEEARPIAKSIFEAQMAGGPS